MLLLKIHMSVYLCRYNRTMTKQMLNISNVNTLFQ